MAEPTLVVGGAIALLMLLAGGKKKKKPTADQPGHIPGGGSDTKKPVGDPDAGVTSGGNKQPGQGWDDSDYAPPSDLGPNDLWIAPDCLGVIEGDTWWQNRFRPRALHISSTWNRDWAPGANDVMGITLGRFVFTGTPEPLMDPGTIPDCMSDWPGWYWGTIYDRTSTQADLDQYESDLDAYAAEFPAMASFLETLKQRMLNDPQILNALLDAQKYPPNVLYFTGDDPSLVTAAGEYIMQIAGDRFHEAVDYDRLLRIYPESFPANKPFLVFMRPQGQMGFLNASVDWSERPGGPMTFAIDLDDAERRDLVQPRIDLVINEVGWLPGGQSQA